MTKLQRAILNLLKYCPGNFPYEETYKGPFYDKGDENAPFFSEAYLYNLMGGKDEARTLLGCMKNICEAAHIDMGEQRVKGAPRQGRKVNELKAIRDELRRVRALLVSRPQYLPARKRPSMPHQRRNRFLHKVLKEM